METACKGPIIQVTALRKEYPVGEEVVVALKSIDLAIPRGEICCIFGTSGSGKSTLLNQLAGMEKPTRGQVSIGGVPIGQLSEEALARFRQEHLGFVFQSYNLLPALTAVENVALPLMFRGVPRAQRERAAAQMLRQVGLSHRLHHYPGQMSGGQQQRVGIARALVTDPEIIFADEPTGNLDSNTSDEVMHAICKTVREKGKTLIMVTHDPNMAEFADKIINILDGKIIDIRYHSKAKA